MSGRPEPRIREAADEELDTVASLIVDAYAEHAARISPDAWSMFAQDIANVRGRILDAVQLVAEDEGRLVGAVSLYLDWRGAQEDSASVRLLAVPPEERGHGVGTALMRACIDRARSAGKRRVVFSLIVGMDGAREINAKLGFVREPGLDHEPAPGMRAQGYELTLT